MKFDHLLPAPALEHLVDHWLAEDIPSFDYGGYVVGNKQDTAILYAKSIGVLAGVPFFDAIFKRLNCTVQWLMEEGHVFPPETSDIHRVAVARIHGEARQILTGERSALNMLARASGIASLAHRLNLIRTEKNWHGVIAGTRKTTPGFRLVEKYAMLVGGVDTHRMDLSSMIMLKDNHIWSRGSITEAVKSARQVGGFALKIEVECRSLAEAEEAIQAGADVVMLDNFEAEGLWEAAKVIKSKYPKGILVEGSGGLTEESVGSYMSPHVDVLSLGCLSQGVKHVDFSLKIQKSE